MQKWYCLLALFFTTTLFAQDKKALFYLDQAEKEFKLRKYNDGKAVSELEILTRFITEPMPMVPITAAPKSTKHLETKPKLPSSISKPYKKTKVRSPTLAPTCTWAAGPWKTANLRKPNNF